MPFFPDITRGPWVLGGLRIDEESEERQKLVFYVRSIIVKERAD